MEHTIKQKVHLDSGIFKELVQATSESLKIPVSFVEKDYYISEVLRALSRSVYAQQIVFKGGTSLSKAYQLIDRFSEDVDFAVISGRMSGNQVKILLSNLMKVVTTDLVEDNNFADISKGSKYRKQAFTYNPQMGVDAVLNPIPARVIVEISAFANPFPYEEKMIETFVTTHLKSLGLDHFIEQYDLQPFRLNVLSLRQTLCEKVVALIRFSMSEDPWGALASKIRHFYDLNALLSLSKLADYVSSKDFVRDIVILIKHDQAAFDEPSGWKELKDLHQSPLMINFDSAWEALSPKYNENLSAIAYRTIPPSETIKASFLKILRGLNELDLSEHSFSA